MKYANILYTGRDSLNLGDVLLHLSINNIYKKMNIPNEEIIRIPYNELATYDGENVILPIVTPFMGYHDGLHIFCYSNKITPVFISLCFITNTLNNDDINYLKNFEPIGCRDWHTYEVLKKYGINAYVNGCITITMEFSKIEVSKHKRTLLIDVDDDLLSLVPKKLLETSEKYTQIHDTPSENIVEVYVYNIYQKYISEASLIITSRLHCAIPCMMAGIPVIFAGNEFENRFNWIEPFLPFYDKTQWSSINWSGSFNPEIFSIKKQMEAFIISRLKNVNATTMALPNFISNNIFKKTRKDSYPLFEHIIKSTEELLKHNSFSSFAIWGTGQLAEMIYNYMNIKHSNIHFEYLLDSYKVGSFHNTNIQNPNCLKDSNIDFIFVTPITIIGSAKKNILDLLNKLNIKSLFISDYLSLKQ